MGAKKRAISFRSMMLGAVIALGACGVTTVADAPAGPAPDSVSIEIDAPSPTSPAAKPVVTLRDAALVSHLYATVYALPVLPVNQPCSTERGPHYMLTFRRSTTTLVSVEADRDGCRPVTIAGNTSVRQGTNAFWQLLDQVISIATPPLRPDRLAVAFTPDTGRAPESALITSAATARQFYDTILALPQPSAESGCSPELVPPYQFVFFAGTQALSASLSDTCKTISVAGGYHWRGGTFSVTDQFRRVLQSVLAQAVLAPARPDQLALYVVKGLSTSYQVNVSDTLLVLALYDRVFTLPATAAQPGCPPNSDKLAGTGTYATLTFTQWSLPLVQIATYEGSCRFVALSPIGQWLRADPAFWDLIHRALAQ